jgi:predicted Fe-Mo cluster-binding NifX family protein
VTLLSTTIASGADPDYRPDKFAIAAEGDQTSAKLAKLTGVAPYYHIYAIDGEAIEVFANPHLELEFGTGPAAATSLADKGVTVLVGGFAGPKMADVLEARNVRFVERYGTVQDVVDELRGE